VYDIDKRETITVAGNIREGMRLMQASKHAREQWSNE